MMAERLFKFLRRGSVGPFSGFEWQPGKWVEASGGLEACVNGVHVCRLVDLPYWLADELWLVEAEGERLEHAQKLVVRRARLRSPVEGWPKPIARELAKDCVWRVRDLAVAQLQRLGQPEAELLAEARSLNALGELAAKAGRSRRPDRPAAAAGFLGYAEDAVEYAKSRDAVAARYVSYVAAHAADRAAPTERLAPGVTRFAQERERQARVLEKLRV
jgi:hypothetical protein